MSDSRQVARFVEGTDRQILAFRVTGRVREVR